MFRIIVNNHALIFVPVLYLSWFDSALYNVSWKRSFAISWSRVRLTANGLKGLALPNNNSLNSAADIKILFNFYECKIKQTTAIAFSLFKDQKKRKQFCSTKNEKKG
jgi:hypothetical protein